MWLEISEVRQSISSFSFTFLLATSGLHTSQSQQVRKETEEMAGGTFATQGSHPRHAEDGAITGSVVIICIVAASAGLIFGYDVGISG